MKVGDYVRTKNGIITKIIGNRKNPYGEETIFGLDKKISIYDLELNNMYLTTNPLAEDTTNEIDTHFGDEKIIKKSSPNIIYLIEPGDYVNGEQVSRIKQCPEYHLGDGILIFNEHNETIYSNFRTSKYYDIKSIVTREQFSQMEYRIGE